MKEYVYYSKMTCDCCPRVGGFRGMPMFPCHDCGDFDLYQKHTMKIPEENSDGEKI